MSNKKLYRSMYDKKLGGVCGGIAQYLDIDSSVVRLLWILGIFLGGSGILIYIICLFIIPSEQSIK